MIKSFKNYLEAERRVGFKNLFSRHISGKKHTANGARQKLGNRFELTLRAEP